MTPEKKPIAVLGAGAVGSILAASLAEAGEEVLLVESVAARRAQIAERGLPVAGVRSYSARPRAVLGSVDELRQQRPAALFLCTKTWSLRSVLPALAAALPPETILVSFQNGIGVEDELALHFPRARVARGIVNYAGGVGADGTTTVQWFNPPNYLGPLEDAPSPELERLAAALGRVRMETVTVPAHEIKRRAFFKAILNAGLSALCASTGITMRQAMTQRQTRHLAGRLVSEGLAVAAALGYHYGERAHAECMSYLDQGGDHMPSMWVDLEHGRPTEIEHINGKIVEIGLGFRNLEVSANALLTAMIVTREIKSGARAPAEVPEYLTRF
jgi:2-dehydropantoate 2-reductase